MRLHQAAVGARIGDAITQIALNLRETLREFGESELFALHIDPGAAHDVLPLAALPESIGSDDLLLVHVSIGDERFESIVEGLSARVVVVYHNITPYELFLDHDPGFARYLLDGRAFLKRLSDRAEVAVSYSAFNIAELEATGFRRVFRVPLAVDPFRLLRVSGDLHFAASIRDRIPGPLILAVGQVLPHKNLPELIAAHHLLVSHHLPAATLVIAGPHGMPTYAQYLQRLADSFALGGAVWLTGVLSEHQLAELYRAADVWVTASLHEGFCVPAVEAMAASVPVVAVDSGALPETVGDAGLIVANSAAHLAEGVAYMYERRNDEVLKRFGRERARSYERANPAAAVRELVGDLLDR